MSESKLIIKRVGTYTTSSGDPSECTECGNAEWGDVLVDGVCGKCLLKGWNAAASLRSDRARLVDLLRQCVYALGTDPHWQFNPLRTTARHFIDEIESETLMQD